MTKINLSRLTIIGLAATLFLAGWGCQKEEIAADPYWTSATDRGDIPDKPIEGTINNEPIDLKTVQITKFEDEYDWTFSNVGPDVTCGVIVDDDAVNFSAIKLAEGTFEKKMSEDIKFDEYHAYYHYLQDDGVPMSVNPEWAARVVVNEIDEEARKVSGWAKFEFSDGRAAIEGAYTADLCE